VDRLEAMAAHNDFVTGNIARHVCGERLWDRLMTLAQFGASDRGGIDRQALSDAEVAARSRVVHWGEAIGLAASTDPVANLFLRYEGTEPDLPPVLVGSHIDTQPTGGKFDGAFGVLAALESVEAIIARGIRPRRSIEIVAWMNEEGSRFAPGMMGSAVFSGARKLEDILGVRDHAGMTVDSELRKILSAQPRLPQRPPGMMPAAFLEAHIEQGPVLELEKKTVGVVTGIQGKRTFRVAVDGEENHAGTSPRSVRRDALACAVDIVHALQDAIWDREDIVRFTVGMFTVHPNAPSVVPGQVVFSIDLRHPDAQRLRQIGDSIPAICQDCAGRCEATVEELLHDPPLEFPLAIRQTIRSISSDLDIPWMDISSGAGHDARYLHYVCPTGMIFIPCKNGISHSAAESVLEKDAADGARVLAETAFVLANAD
jgi:beta-ureidopropionase / N-carbamoyl-L-amino-acid hydrolase